MLHGTGLAVWPAVHTHPGTLKGSMMAKLDAAQKKWLAVLGSILGSDAGFLQALTAQPSAPAEAPSPAGKGAETAAAAPAAAAQAEEVLQDRRREFKRCRAQWVAVKQRAEQDLEKVKDGAHMAYLADAAQFPKIVAGCKAIDDILDNLDDELRDTLDQYASTPLRDQKKLEKLAGTAKELLDRYQQFVASNQLMKAIDEKEFADVVVHAPVTKALKDLRKALA